MLRLPRSGLAAAGWELSIFFLVHAPRVWRGSSVWTAFWRGSSVRTAHACPGASVAFPVLVQLVPLLLKVYCFFHLRWLQALRIPVMPDRVSSASSMPMHAHGLSSCVTCIAFHSSSSSSACFASFGLPSWLGPCGIFSSLTTSALPATGQGEHREGSSLLVFAIFPARKLQLPADDTRSRPRIPLFLKVSSVL